MPGGNRSQQGNELFGQALYVPAITYPTLASNVSGTNTFTLSGVLQGDLLSWNLQAPPAHIFLENAYVSAPNVVTLSWTTDSTGISTGSIAIIIEITRPENASLGLVALPSTLT